MTCEKCFWLKVLENGLSGECLNPGKNVYGYIDDIKSKMEWCDGKLETGSNIPTEIVEKISNRVCDFTPKIELYNDKERFRVLIYCIIKDILESLPIISFKN